MQCEIGDYQYQCTYDSSIYYTKKFTNHQISLLEQEKKFDKEGQEDERKKYGKIYGNVLNQSVPAYGGIIVTFKLKISGEQGKGNPFKQGSPIKIEVLSPKEPYRGTVVLVR